MFRCVTKIEIQQQGAGRTKKLSFDFVNSFDCTDTWVDFTNQANVKFPQNMWARDENGQLYSLQNSIGGGDNPLFKRGDKISINFGYRYFDSLGNEKLDLPINPIFSGYISEVSSRKPIALKCEDNMWILKQTPAPNKLFTQKAYKTWENVLRKLVQGTGFTVNAVTATDLPTDIRIMNESVAQVMKTVRDQFHFEAYFRGNELRCGSLVYVEPDAVNHNFVFQQNIVSDELEYKRKDDIVLSAVVHSMNEIDTDEQDNEGRTKTKKDRLEILVYQPKAGGDFAYIKKEKGKEFPPNVQGERYTVPLVGVTDVDKMFELGKNELKKFYYTGFRGKFTAFAVPYVRQGDNVILFDRILPERNGKYKVKGVNYSGGVSGHRQEIILHYLIPTT